MAMSGATTRLEALADSLVARPGQAHALDPVGVGIAALAADVGYAGQAQPTRHSRDPGGRPPAALLRWAAERLARGSMPGGLSRRRPEGLRP